jgi:DNA-binding NarL/FixJ family response regulator
MAFVLFSAKVGGVGIQGAGLGESLRGEDVVRVLVADAQARTRRAVGAPLEEDGRFAVVAEAGDAAGAVAAAVEHGPDLCLLDVRLPGHAIWAAWEIAARLPRTRIVMLAESVDEGDVLAALRAGALGYLLKEMSSARLAHALWDVAQGNTAIPGELMARIVDQLRHPTPRRQAASGADDPPRLTSREWQILSLLRDDLTTSEIANRLSLTQATVRSHRARVLRKLETAGVVVALDSARKADGSSRRPRRSAARRTSSPIPLKLMQGRVDAAIDAHGGCRS